MFMIFYGGSVPVNILLIMRKTFLKVALIGALAVAMPSTFTSCKDYDDDITDVQGQTAELRKQLESVNTAIAALPTKADVSAAQAAAVAQAKTDLEAVKVQLQAAIDGKADQTTVDAINTELSSIKGQLEAIEALKGDVATALESINQSITDLKAEAVTKGQMDAALAAQKEELQQYSDGKVAALVSEVEDLQSLVNDPNSGVAALQKQIEELAEKINGETDGEGATSLEAVIRLLNGMITHIEIVGVNANDTHRGYDKVLNLYTVNVAQDLVFGQGYAADGSGQLGYDANTFTVQNKEVFKKGEVKTFNDSILVRVSPANAVVTAEQIQLVNSKGEDLSKFVDITSVEAYKGLLTNMGSRSISNNGLHVVKFALKESFNDVEGFVAATDANNGKKNQKALINFAVAIADSDKDLAEGREITSAYDLVVNATPNAPQYELEYNVVHNGNKVPVTNIRNRFRFANDNNNDNSSLMFPTFKDFETNMSEVYAKRVSQNNYTNAASNGFTAVGDFAWVENAKEEQVATYANSGAIYDDRTSLGYELLEVKPGETFTVDMSGYNIENQNGIYGFYVTLDMWRATESNGSEREAWKSIAPSISGINAVTTDNEIALSISKDAKVDAGEILGFRVYAVNFDGTLVDPDGRAFYVVVNKPVEATATATASISAPAANSYASAAVSELGAWTATTPAVNVQFFTDGFAPYGQYSTKYLNKNPQLPNEIYVVLKNGNGVTLNNGSYTRIDRGSDGSGYDVLKNIRVALPNWQYADGETYTGTLTITDASTELVLQTIKVEITKTVANNAPTDFGINTANGFPAEGDLTAVITNTAGTYNINTVFNWGKWNNANLTSSDYTEVVTFQPKNDKWNAKTTEAVNGVFNLSTVELDNRNEVQNFNNKVINNGKYPMTVAYEYTTQFSYVPQTKADGTLADKGVWSVNGQEIEYQPYVMKSTTYSMSRNISFVTIASQLTFAWKPASGSGATAVPAYAPALTYDTDGTIDLTKVMANQTITEATPWKNATIASLIAAGKINNATVKLPVGLDTYFTAAINGTEITFTPKPNTETPMSNISGQVQITFNDDVAGSSAITLSLPTITMNK